MSMPRLKMMNLRVIQIKKNDKFLPLQIESDEALRPAHQHDPGQFFLSVKQI